MARKKKRKKRTQDRPGSRAPQSSGPAGAETLSRKQLLRRDYSIALLCSSGVHLALLIGIIVSGFQANWKDKPIIVSVTLEGGKKLGAITQVPDKGKSQKAPPKAEAALSKPKVQGKKAEKDAEVSLAKETPKPTPKASPKPKKTAKPSPKKTPKKKSTPKPVKKKPVKKPLYGKDDEEKLRKAIERYKGESTNAGGSGFGAGRIGGSGMGGGQVRPPEFFRYSQLLEKLIKRDWAWHDRRARLRAAVCFNLSASGVMSNISLCTSSGNRLFDSSVMRATQKANPLPPPPQSVYRDFFQSLKINFRSEDS